jgi:hypothetical protein
VSTAFALVPAGGSRLLADSDTGKGSPIGFFVVLVLVIAVYFLYRSMNRHLKNVPATFEPAKLPEPAEPSQLPEPIQGSEPVQGGEPVQPAEPVPPGEAVPPAGEAPPDETAQAGSAPVTPREPGPDRP